MIIPKYSILSSRIANAGKGVFLTEPVKRGTVIVAPDQINNTISHSQFEKLPGGSLEINSSIRWFETHYTICPEWTDECYINHSFTPSGLWHLGFVFAIRDLDIDSEITMDYRYILGEDCRPEFNDSETGQDIVGLPWQCVIHDTTRTLLSLLSPPATK